MIKKILGINKRNINFFCRTFPVGYELEKDENKIQISKTKYNIRKLSNGITTIIETPEIPKYVTLHIKLKGGLLYENSETSGYNKWLENSILEKLSKSPKVKMNTDITLERDGLEITSNMLSNQVENYLEVFSSFFQPDILNNDILNHMEWNGEEEDKNIEEVLIKTAFQNYSYGKPLIGLKENYLNKVDFSFKARELHSKVINSSDIIISAGGIYNIDDFVELLDRKFSFIQPKSDFSIEEPTYKGGQLFLPPVKKSKQIFYSETDMFSNQIGICFPTTGLKDKKEEILLLNEYIGESSYFISEGPGKGVYLLAADIMRKCYPASEVKSFFKQWENMGIFGFYLKGIENSQSVLAKGLVNLIQEVNKEIDEVKFLRAKNILKRKYIQNLENQFVRIPIVTRDFIFTGQIVFEDFYPKIDSISKDYMQNLIGDILDPKYEKTLAGIGPLNEKSFK